VTTTNVEFPVQSITTKVDRKGKGKERAPVMGILEEFDGITDVRSTSPKRPSKALRRDRDGESPGKAVKRRKSGDEVERTKKKARSPDLDEMVSVSAHIVSMLCLTS
jgi:hypothetical protein